MGVDKEAVDIWRFGRPRPDLSLDEVLAAPEPTLTDAEKDRRQTLVDASHARRMPEMIKALNSARVVKARAAAAFGPDEEWAPPWADTSRD